MSRNLIIILVLFITLAIGLILVTTSSNLSFQNPPPTDQTLTSSENLEFFLTQNPTTPEIAESYRFALENPQQVLTEVKCYCGCLNQGHTNNRDCFINEEGGFDLMGLNCGLCVKTALIAKQMLSEGKSVAEISNYVDSRWGNII